MGLPELRARFTTSEVLNIPNPAYPVDPEQWLQHVVADSNFDEVTEILWEELGVEGGVPDAIDVSFDPYMTMTSDNVQNAIEELYDLIGTGGAHTHDAVDIDFAPYGDITATDVQNALQQLEDKFGGYSLDTHDHDDDYAPFSHDHDDDYAPFVHDHDGDYAPFVHDHDEDYAPFVHSHDEEYSASGHSHLATEVSYSASGGVPGGTAQSAISWLGTNKASATHVHSFAAINNRYFSLLDDNLDPPITTMADSDEFVIRQGTSWKKIAKSDVIVDPGSGGTPQGPNESLQYKVDASNFGGDANLSWSGAILTINGGISGNTTQALSYSTSSSVAITGGNASLSANSGALALSSSSNITMTSGGQQAVVNSNGLSVNSQFRVPGGGSLARSVWASGEALSYRSSATNTPYTVSVDGHDHAHSELTSVLGGGSYHLSSAQYSALTSGGNASSYHNHGTTLYAPYSPLTSLTMANTDRFVVTKSGAWYEVAKTDVLGDYALDTHVHAHSELTSVLGGGSYHLSSAQYTGLTNGGDASTYHNHGTTLYAPYSPLTSLSMATSDRFVITKNGTWYEVSKDGVLGDYSLTGHTHAYVPTSHLTASAAHTAQNVSYDGGGPFYDGGTLPSTDVNAALDTIPIILRSTTADSSGAHRVGSAAITTPGLSISSGSVYSALYDLTIAIGNISTVGPSSPTGSVQFNVAGNFGGTSNFLWTGAGLAIVGGLNVSGSASIAGIASISAESTAFTNTVNCSSNLLIPGAGTGNRAIWVSGSRIYFNSGGTNYYLSGKANGAAT